MSDSHFLFLHCFRRKPFLMLNPFAFDYDCATQPSTFKPATCNQIEVVANYVSPHSYDKLAVAL
jgi:hypothetical protein